MNNITLLPFVTAWNNGDATVLVGVGGILLISMLLTGLGVLTPSATSEFKAKTNLLLHKMTL